MNPAAVRLESMRKSYGPDRVIFDGLDLEIPPEGFTFIVGRSGSGKTVLCRIAVGLERPDSGRVWLFGKEVQSLSDRDLLEVRRAAPYLVQAPALIDWLTVEQNVTLAVPRGDRQQVRAALKHVDIDRYADREPPELGPGLKKRAAIARALALDPQFLLFDEPTTGLDRRAGRQVADALAALRDEGLGAVVVSHDYGLLERIADRVFLVTGGGVRRFETRDDFLRSPDPEVRELLDPVREELVRHG